MSKKIRIAFNHLDFYIYFGLTSSCPLVLHSWIILMQICITKKNTRFTTEPLLEVAKTIQTVPSMLYVHIQRKKSIFLIFIHFLGVLVLFNKDYADRLKTFINIPPHKDKTQYLFTENILFSNIMYNSHGSIRISVNKKCDNIPFCKWWFLSFGTVGILYAFDT